MKLAGPRAAAYFAKPDPNHSGLLIYGADTMRVALRRQEVVKAIVGDKGEEEMRFTRIAAADLRKEPALVLDGLKSQGFFPGPRAVLVEDAGDGLAPTLETALSEWQMGDAMLIVTAGQLNARSKLRKVFESTQTTVAIGIYNDPPSKEEINATLQKAGLTNIAGEAMTDLQNLGRELDPGDFAQTMEKLSLYKFGDDTPVSSADVETCAPATSDAGIDDAIHIVAEAKSSEVGPILKRLFGQGINPTTLCISATRHFRILHAAASHADGPDVALSRARPPVFGARKDRMVRQARNWGSPKLEKALEVLMETDLSLRSSRPLPDAALVERAFIRLAMMARGRN
ncbi:DNA polymerase III subunit delta [Amylibacter kogurei]|uniref:DNA-directed DNA polymerase n=1 Tax=Paramylibacter kogurei TaxID=1889778 RepID=A0A2G5K2E0_9RHOB|nr:DNA polymerase III subunit delta [Amylibacter kogurei]PIB23090.1 DNA polymerase III subunit delta [Amylibacter kogurei]